MSGKSVIRTNSKRKKTSNDTQSLSFQNSTRLSTMEQSKKNIISPYKKLLFGEQDMYYKRSSKPLQST